MSLTLPNLPHVIPIDDVAWQYTHGEYQDRNVSRWVHLCLTTVHWVLHCENA